MGTTARALHEELPDAPGIVLPPCVDPAILSEDRVPAELRRRRPDCPMRVFISYRRDDSAGYAGRLCDQLSGRLGANRVFRDVVDIAPGADFVRAIDDAVSSCDALVVLVGARWLDLRDANGRRRLDDPTDYVRRELAAALTRGIPVIPVLIERAVMPAEGDLPDELRPFARRNAIELRDAAWDQDAERLIQAIEPASGRLAASSAPAHRAIRLIAIAGAITVAAAVGGWLASRPAPAPPPRSSEPLTGSARPAGSPASGAGAALLLPPQARTTLFGAGGDSAVYEIRAAGLEPASGTEQLLVLSIRMTNNTSYPLNFWDESFRLLIDGVAHAPVGGLNELVPARTAQDNRVVFLAPAGGQNVVLRIGALGRFSDVEFGNLRPAGPAGGRP